MASAISKGPPFPYTFGEKIDLEQSIWTLYNGTKRVQGDGIRMEIQADLVARKTALLAVFSPTMSRPTNHDYPLLRMLYGSYER